MSATKVLKLARSAGIRVGIDGDYLTLEAPVPPPAEVLELLERHKSEIVTLLIPRNDGWSSDDWLNFYEKQVLIFESAGMQSRVHAETSAFFVCIGEWSDRNPTRSQSRRCAQCGQFREMMLPHLTDYSTKDPGYTWLHQGCSQAWHNAYRIKAVSALIEIGISVPVNFADDFDKKKDD